MSNLSAITSRSSFFHEWIPLESFISPVENVSFWIISSATPSFSLIELLLNMLKIRSAENPLAFASASTFLRMSSADSLQLLLMFPCLADSSSTVLEIMSRIWWLWASDDVRFLLSLRSLYVLESELICWENGVDETVNEYKLEIFCHSASTYSYCSSVCFVAFALNDGEALKWWAVESRSWSIWHVYG